MDLGLPSGLLWAKYNLGAASEKDAGLYFQWGDTKGYTVDQIGEGDGKKPFSSNFSDYVFYENRKIAKYNRSDGKVVLDLEDDAAHVLLGAGWKMPTREDFHELMKNTDLFMVTEDGREISGAITKDEGETGEMTFEFDNEVPCIGVRFYKKGDRLTYLHIPSSGVLCNSFQNSNSGYLYSSSVNETNSLPYAWNFYFGNNSVDISGAGLRCFGCPIRGVKPGATPV